MSQTGLSSYHYDTKDEKANGISSEDSDLLAHGMEDSINIQYQLPDSYCYESAIFFDKKPFERPFLHKMVKEWHTEILQKRMVKKKKNEDAIALTRTRNESQCSVDSVTVSGDSQEMTCEDQSEENLDIITDSFESDLEKNSESPLHGEEIPLEANNKLPATSMQEGGAHLSPSSLNQNLVLPPTTTSHHSPDFSLSSLTSSQLNISVPKLTIPVSLQSASSGSYFPNSSLPNFGLNINKDLITPLGMQHFKNSAPDMLSSTPKSEKSRLNLSSFAIENSKCFGPTLLPLAAAHMESSGPSLSSLAATHMESSGPSLPSLAAAHMESSGPSLSSLAAAHMESSGPSLSSLAAAHMESSGPSLPSLAAAHMESSGPSLSSLAAAHTESSGPSLSSLAAAHMESSGPSLSSLAAAHMESSGPSLPSLAAAHMESSGPSLSSLAAAHMDSSGPSLPSLAAAHMESSGSSLSSLAAAHMESSGPSLSSLAAAHMDSTGPSLSSLAAAHMDSTGPSLSSLAAAHMESFGPSLSSLAAAHMVSSGPSLSSLAAAHMESSGPTSASISYVAIPNPLEKSCPIESLHSNNSPSQQIVIPPPAFLCSTMKATLPSSIQSPLRNLNIPKLIGPHKDQNLSNFSSLGVGGCGLPVPTTQGNLREDDSFASLTKLHHENNLTSSVMQSDCPLDDTACLLPFHAKSPLVQSCQVLQPPPGFKLPPGLSLSPGQPSSSGLPPPHGLPPPPGFPPPPSKLSSSGLSSLQASQSPSFLPPSLLSHPSLPQPGQLHYANPHYQPDLIPGRSLALTVKQLPEFDDSFNRHHHPYCVPGIHYSEIENLEMVFQMEEAEDMTPDIDLQAALVKPPEESIPAPVSEKCKDISVTIEQNYIETDSSLRKLCPSTFGQVMVRIPRTPQVKRLTEKIICVPFRIFKFDCPSPDELVREALRDHQNPAWYRLATRERQNRR